MHVWYCDVSIVALPIPTFNVSNIALDTLSAVLHSTAHLLDLDTATINLYYTNKSKNLYVYACNRQQSVTKTG
jgi:hypothetical protein